MILTFIWGVILEDYYTNDMYFITPKDFIIKTYRYYDVMTNVVMIETANIHNQFIK